MLTTGAAHKLAVISGAGSGLGQAYCRQLAGDGWHLALVDRDAAAAAESLALVQSLGGRGQVKVMDVRSADAWAELVAELKRDFDHCDLLVNNAGVCGSGEVGVFGLADWQWLFEINVMGYVNACHTFVGWLKLNPRGAAVICTSSVAGFLSAPTMAAYSASKAAVTALTETLYTELHNTKVRVTLVLPSFFRTNLLSQGRFAAPEQKAVAARESAATGLTADAVAKMALAASRKGQLYVVAPFLTGKLHWFLKRLMPTTMLRIVAVDAARRLSGARRRGALMRRLPADAVAH